jgi:hypothetical protein
MPMFGLNISVGRVAGLLTAFVIMAAVQVRAQDQHPASQAAPAVTLPDAPSPPPEVLTGKERLGPKWTDEQRTDNCRVPLDKRGAKPRPDTCPGHSE